MLFIGNFSFTDMNDENDNYCLMPVVVDAPDTDTALDRFSTLMNNLHESSLLLAGAKDIYLDSLIQLDESPEEALVVQWQKIIAGDDGMYSVLSALPGEEDYAEAYNWGSDDTLEQIELVATDLIDEETIDEMTPQELAEALTDALSSLADEDAERDEEEDLEATEEAFISFS